MPATVDNSKYLTSSRSLRAAPEIVIHGPPGVGKTFAAATASVNWPSALPSSDWVRLYDMLWLPADAGALDGLTEAKIEVPLIDLRQMMIDLGPLKGAFAAAELAVQAAKSPDLRIIVLDTVSTLDKVVQEHLHKNSGDDKWMMYRELLNFHKRFHSYLRATGKQVITLAHSRALMEPVTTGDKNRQAAVQLPGLSSIVADITGQGHGIYINDASIVFAMRAQVVKGQPTKRTLYPLGYAGFEAKNRFGLTLGHEEPADLGDIFRRISAASSQ